MNGREGAINGACLSRKHLIHEVEESLKRLQTDYIDLYQWHCFDKSTPLEESLRTMDDLIKAGKIRYFGVSNFAAWQLQKVGFQTFIGIICGVNQRDFYLYDVPSIKCSLLYRSLPI